MDIESRRISRTIEYKWVHLQRKEQRKKGGRRDKQRAKSHYYSLSLGFFHPLRSFEIKILHLNTRLSLTNGLKDTVNLIDDVCIVKLWALNYFDSIFSTDRSFQWFLLHGHSNCINYDILVTIRNINLVLSAHIIVHATYIKEKNVIIR